MKPVAFAFSVIMLAAGCVFAGEVIDSVTIDGKTYESVKFGPVNQGKVVIYHSRGVAIVPLDKIPPEIAPNILGHDTQKVKPMPGQSAPNTARPPLPPNRAASPAEQQAFEQDRATKVLLDGKLVEKSRLTELTGFLAYSRVDVKDGDRSFFGAIIELARRKPGSQPVAKNLEMRPGLWERTGQSAVLLNYVPDVEEGLLVRVYGTEIAPITDSRAFVVGRELTFSDWKGLRGK